MSEHINFAISKINDTTVIILKLIQDSEEKIMKIENHIIQLKNKIELLKNE